VLLELAFWINIDFIYFINDFWMYIYWALGDQSTSVQTIALKVGTYYILILLISYILLYLNYLIK